MSGIHEAMLKRAEKIASLGHWHYDVQKNILFWSDEIFAIHGVHKKTYSPCLETAIRFYHKDDRSLVRSSVEKALKQGEKFYFQARIVRPSGDIRHVVVHGEPEFDDDLQIVGLFGVFQDKTKLFLAKKELEFQKHFLQTVIDEIPDLIFVKDEKLRIQMANKAFLDLYSHPENVIGKTTYENYPPRQVEAFTENDKKALKSGYLETKETITSLSQKETSIFFTKKVAFQDAKDKQYLLGIARDITSFEKTRQKLEESKRRFDIATNVAQVGIWDWNLKSNEIYLSSAFQKILEIETKQQKYHESFTTFTNRFQVDCRDKFKAMIAEYSRSGAPFTFEGKVISEQKGVLWLELSGQYIKSTNGEPEQVIGTALNITERKNYEAMIQRNIADLKRSNKDLNDFSYIASHDLKEPLRGFHNYSLFLEEDYGDLLPPEGLRMLQKMKELSQKMDGLLNALLQYSRVGRSALNGAQIGLNQMLDVVRDTFSFPCEKENCEIIIHKNLPTLFGDPVYIKEVFLNLISNAFKYNVSGKKKVEIGFISSQQKHSMDTKLKNFDDHVVIYVKDNGIGIDKRHYDQVFQIFKRLHGKDDYGGGTGAGLSIVEKIMQRHDGKIWIEPNPEGGTIFYLKFKNYVSFEAEEKYAS